MFKEKKQSTVLKTQPPLYIYLVDSLLLQHVNIELLMLVVWWCILSKAIIVAARGRVEAGRRGELWHKRGVWVPGGI